MQVLHWEQWSDTDIQKFIDDAHVTGIEPTDFNEEEVSVYHCCEDSALRDRLEAKLKSFGATKVRFTKQP